ncbi:hypothetical protein EAS64_02375 [Trebonia kvetii]|uniref:Uncharacterized protein n=1 Tax=Trebonia kvetii TaxID=2480626 RepID=A0A6P2C4Y0_9ACTN|nr:hypothetical protein [Trebonia kvetii]TVZ06298.1 hypothetical protein EAS64_02375 [Trebonia kvetii]
MTGRGHRAALPDGDHARPDYVTTNEQGGLVVRHYNRHGQVLEFDFSELPVAPPMQASLAALFAARCTPAYWSVHRTSKTAWVHLRSFAQFLAQQQRPPRDLDDLTPELVRQWRSSCDYMCWIVIAAMLRADARLQAGHAADELARRRKPARSKVQSYSEAELGEVRKAARRQFRSALQRINDNALHLQRWRDGTIAEGSRDWVIGEGLDLLARTGALPKYTDKNGRLTVKGRYRIAFGGSSGAATWQRLFLTREAAAALGVLLMAEFGWNLSVIDTLAVPVASPDQGSDGHPTYHISLEKPRRGPGRSHETRNVTDHGAGSPGRLITQALAATRFARAIVEETAPGTNRLIVWRSNQPGRPQADGDRLPPVGPFSFGVHSDAGSTWARAAGLGGSPFRRGRRTVVALDRREPAQHSQETHDRAYVLPDKRVQAQAVEVIAGGAEDAAARARTVVLVAQVRDQPDPGDVETATADCCSPDDSPWPSPGGGCGASFLLCLACPNARVHAGHHPRLAHLHEALGSLRSVLPPAAWAADWRDAHERLEDLRERVGEGPWTRALARVTDADRALIHHLLTGNLDE